MLNSNATLGTEEKLRKIKVLTTLAAMTITATAIRTPTRTRVACATMAAACAGWLAGRTSGAAKGSDESKREEKNRKEESTNQRAIGLKKVKKIVEDTETNGKDLQGKTNLQDQKMMRSRKFTKMGYPQEVLGMYPQEVLGIYSQEVLGREPQGELGIDPQGFLGMDEPPSRLGWVDLHEVFGWKAKGSSDESIGEPLKQACGSLNETALAEAAVNQHHCPSGCPSQKSRSDMEAKTSSHVGFGKHGRDGESPGDDTNRDRDGPWCTPKFLVAPAVKGQDQWNCLDYKDKQYWVKVHHAPRLKAFHPLHRNQPFDSETLGKSRVTVKFFAWNHTMPQKTFDNWTSRGEKHDVLPRGEDRWIGYTFFEVHKEKKTLWKDPVVPQSFRNQGRYEDEEGAHRGGKGGGVSWSGASGEPWNEGRIPQGYKGGDFGHGYGGHQGSKGHGRTYGGCPCLWAYDRNVGPYGGLWRSKLVPREGTWKSRAPLWLRPRWCGKSWRSG